MNTVLEAVITGIGARGGSSFVCASVSQCPVPLAPVTSVVGVAHPGHTVYAELVVTPPGMPHEGGEMCDISGRVQQAEPLPAGADGPARDHGPHGALPQPRRLTRPQGPLRRLVRAEAAPDRPLDPVVDGRVGRGEGHPRVQSPRQSGTGQRKHRKRTRRCVRDRKSGQRQRNAKRRPGQGVAGGSGSIHQVTEELVDVPRVTVRVAVSVGRTVQVE